MKETRIQIVSGLRVMGHGARTKWIAMDIMWLECGASATRVVLKWRTKNQHFFSNDFEVDLRSIKLVLTLIHFKFQL